MATHGSGSPRLNLAITPEARQQLGLLAAAHHRTLGGEVAWLIERAYRQEKAAALATSSTSPAQRDGRGEAEAAAA